MNRRALIVLAVVWAGIGTVALLAYIFRDPPVVETRKPERRRAVEQTAEEKKAADKEAFDTAMKGATEIGATLKLSKMAFDLGLIEKLPDPFDHRKPADAAKAAAAMSRVFPKDVLGDYWTWEVSTDDGRLILNVSPEFLALEPKVRRQTMDSLFNIWQSTKFTIDYGFSRTIEFRSKDGWKEVIEKK